MTSLEFFIEHLLTKIAEHKMNGNSYLHVDDLLSLLNQTKEFINELNREQLKSK